MNQRRNRFWFHFLFWGLLLVPIGSSSYLLFVRLIPNQISVDETLTKLIAGCRLKSACYNEYAILSFMKICIKQFQKYLLINDFVKSLNNCPILQDKREVIKFNGHPRSFFSAHYKGRFRF